MENAQAFDVTTAARQRPRASRQEIREALQGYAFMPTVSTSMDNVVRDMDARGGVGAGFRLAD